MSQPLILSAPWDLPVISLSLSHASFVPAEATFPLSFPPPQLQWHLLSPERFLPIQPSKSKESQKPSLTALPWH